jgi:hypothetical protein
MDGANFLNPTFNFQANNSQMGGYIDVTQKDKNQDGVDFFLKVE